MHVPKQTRPRSGLPIVFAVVFGLVVLVLGALYLLVGDSGVLAFDYGGF